MYAVLRKVTFGICVLETEVYFSAVPMEEEEEEEEEGLPVFIQRDNKTCLLEEMASLLCFFFLLIMHLMPIK
jgi:hypothetical protein